MTIHRQDRRSWLTLAGVAAVHGVLIAALLRDAWRYPAHAPAAEPLLLLVLPTPSRPKDDSNNSPPRRRDGKLASAITVPTPEAPTLAVSAQTAAPADGQGTGIDWAAEARRALHAFEVRRDRPPDNPAVSGDPAGDTWWPRGPHHPGQQFKTPRGDWIVWITAECYQVVGASGPTPARPEPAPPAEPQMVCLDRAHDNTP